MRTIAVINQKGGTGKTTTTVNLAAGLAEQGRRVLVIDLDPQASASGWLGVSDGSTDLLELLTGDTRITGIIRNTSNPGVSVVPASKHLAGAELALAANPAGGSTALRRKLKDLPSGYDYVLFDCPPSLGFLGTNALTAAWEVIIPVEARVMSLSGLARLLEMIETIREGLNHPIEIAGIVVCRVDTRTRHAREVIEKLRETFPGKVFTTMIRENIKLGEAPSFAQPITAYDSSSNGAADYRALALEVIAQEPNYIPS
jgi:chromosome partitioning protein